MEKDPLCLCMCVCMPVSVVTEDTQITKLYHISTFLLIKSYSYVMYIYAEKKFKKRHHMGKLDCLKGKSFLSNFIYYCIVEIFYKNYIKRMFSAGLKFRKKKFTLKKEISRAQ